MEAARAQMREAAEAAEAEAELPTPPGPVEAHDDSPPLDFKAAAHDDWERMKESLKESAAEQAAEDEDSDDELYAERRQQQSSGRWTICLYFGAVFVAVGAAAAYQAYLWANPTPLSASVELVRPSKFKVDVTEFFAPRVSAALQVVLSVKNANLLRAMLLESCKVAAFEEASGTKLGSQVHERPFLVQPFSTAQLTVPIPSLGGSLPPPEHRRLASHFLSEKALLLTLVATCTSRIHAKGSKSTPVTVNATRRVDLSALTKEPFFQRAPPPPPPPPGTEVHDVPV